MPSAAHSWRNPPSSRRGPSRIDDPGAYHAEGVIYLTPNARYDHLLNLPEGSNVGQAINEAMADIEKHNPQLAGVLPRTYQIFNSTLLKELLKKVSEIPDTLEYDAFGRIYEYFLGEFARTEGQKGGEFFTPSAIVRLIVEIIEPFHGRLLDLASGSGGMFVQSARFVQAHKKNPSSELAIHGQEKVGATVALSRMNLAVHGLEGDIREANSYYEDLHKSTGSFDFVLANPPFNVNAVDKDRLKDAVGKNRRYPFGLPRTDNANYLWIQLFYSALNDKGRAGFVMANSASDARASEQEIRKQLIESHAVDVMVAVGPNMFYTVTLPCTLWFLDRGKRKTPREDKVLFIDARHIYRQIDRAHRDWTEAQIGFLANIVRLYRDEELDFTLGGEEAKAKHRSLFSLARKAKRENTEIHEMSGSLQSRHAERNRSTRLVPQPRPLRRSRAGRDSQATRTSRNNSKNSTRNSKPSTPRPANLRKPSRGTWRRFWSVIPASTLDLLGSRRANPRGVLDIRRWLSRQNFDGHSRRLPLFSAGNHEQRLHIIDNATNPEAEESVTITAN